MEVPDVRVVWFRGMAGDLLSTWDQPLLVRYAFGLARFARVLMFDKRGTGSATCGPSST